MITLVDNGHGKETAGKRSPDGSILEWKHTRELAKMIVNGLRDKGYEAKLLTPEDEDISLKERVRRVNEYCNNLGAREVIMVSVHINASQMSGWGNGHGWSAYTTTGVTNSDRLAESIYDSAKEVFKDKKIRKNSGEYSNLESNFYILKNSKCACVLTENFFQDNKKDVEYLLTDKAKEDITKVHVDGIVNYIKNR